jgi:hypothetical protein
VSIASTLLAAGALLTPPGAPAQTAFSVSAHVGDFHVAVADYYRVPERDVIVIRERRIPDYEIPVAFFIAQRAGVVPSRIVDLRLRGDSWWDISVRFGLGAEVFYVPVAVTPGPPYGRAFGHYRKPRKHWNTIVLSDEDIVNLVELRFLSEHYGVPPERVIDARGRHADFVAVHAEVAGHGKSARADRGNGQGGGKSGRGRGRGK